MKLSLSFALTCAALALATPVANPAPAPVGTTTSTASPSPSPSAYATLTNHITACADKFDREQELLLQFLYKVKKNEPGVLEFQLNSAAANNSFLTYEKYASQAAIDHHLNTSYYHHLINAEAAEKTKCAANQVFFLDDVFEFVRSG